MREWGENKKVIQLILVQIYGGKLILINKLKEKNVI